MAYLKQTTPAFKFGRRCHFAKCVGGYLCFINFVSYFEAESIRLKTVFFLNNKKKGQFIILFDFRRVTSNMKLQLNHQSIFVYITPIIMPIEKLIIISIYLIYRLNFVLQFEND